MDNISAIDQKNKAHNDINRADRARQLMEDPMLVEAMTAIKGDLYKKFCATEFKDKAERDELWRKVQTATKFEGYLKSVMTDGIIGQQTLGMLERAKNLIGL